MILRDIYLILMIPEDMGRWLRAELDDASEIYGAALVHIQIGSSQNGGRGHCKWKMCERVRYLLAMHHPLCNPSAIPFINPEIPELC